jgi:hypothetical protein
MKVISPMLQLAVGVRARVVGTRCKYLPVRSPTAPSTAPTPLVFTSLNIGIGLITCNYSAGHQPSSVKLTNNRWLSGAEASADRFDSAQRTANEWDFASADR